ncbi:hypothetical protein ACP4OV_010289 [Aristida adscensionis]
MEDYNRDLSRAVESMATDTIGALPDDVLADILRRLPAPSLAAARCVRKAWCAIVDDRKLLLPHLLPHSVDGIFINYIDHERPHLFARPSPPSAFPAVDGVLGFLPNDHLEDWWCVLDHCDGLLLCAIEWETQLCVCNPATRQWTVLPKNDDDFRRGGANAYLAFDPAVSPHYEVFLIPVVPEKPRLPDRRNEVDDDDDDDDPCRLMEWPPTPWTLQVFSSRTGQWEQRVFLREGEAAGTVEDMRLDKMRPTINGPRRLYAVYHQGALYVHCRGGFVTRLLLADHQYQVIKNPIGIDKATIAKPYLGKSQESVYLGIARKFQLCIWVFNESNGHMDWIFAYDITYHNPNVATHYSYRERNCPWVIEENGIDHMDEEEELLRRKFEWDSDNDDFVEIEPDQGCEILGFHPYKQVVFLGDPFATIAYHLDSSKIQYLGYSRPQSYYHNYTNGICESFIYTPCMIGELVGDSTGGQCSS